MNNPSTISVTVVVEGERACFRRPEFTTDLVSYDVMPPYVAEQILRSIFDAVSLSWSIDRIRVAKPIKFCSEQIASERGPRRSLALKDVKYVVEAHLDCSADEASGLRSEIDQAFRGSHDVYLGAVDYPAKLRRADGSDMQQQLIDPHIFDLGWMVKEQKNKKNRFPIFFRARLIDGCVQINERCLTAS